MENGFTHVIRHETLFAGIRKPIKTRQELTPRIKTVTEACSGNILGPLAHIFRFDTQVDGFDSEIGYPVSAEVNSGEVCTHTLREIHFLTSMHKGSTDTLRETTLQLYEHLNRAGLSPELERMEVYHHYDPENQADNVIETRVSFLAWPEVYKAQLLRVLGPELAAEIWQGGEAITPFTLVDERAAWVAQSLERLKLHTNTEQQFDILSRVALVRPMDDLSENKRIYEESGDINKVLLSETNRLMSTPTRGPIDPWWYKDGVLHLSKVAADRDAYDEAKTPEEFRKAYCFCALIREATDPQVDPIFCYRAAGWARQFYEPILGVEFKKCTLTHSILKGDKFCAWDYQIDD